jgi:hypothetical protein
VDVLALSALVVAILATPVTVWATRQWGNRRARVEFVFSSTPLLPDQVSPGLLAVTFRDIPVKDPHLVSVTLRNTGPRDISTATFDNDRPMSVRFNQTFYGLTAVRGGAHTVSPAVGTPPEDAIVQLKPLLLKRGEAWSFSAVLSGPVEVSIDAPLIDTEVGQVIPEDDRPEITVKLSALGVSAEVPLPWRRDASRSR